ncbi:hypothetical protein HanIR_Chr11g0512441 [Helianthus annuus]|nr:hypothetical protein HanIR_Chr11g0512441 [Helianthus annuus]
MYPKVGMTVRWVSLISYPYSVVKSYPIPDPSPVEYLTGIYLSGIGHTYRHQVYIIFTFLLIY